MVDRHSKNYPPVFVLLAINLIAGFAWSATANLERGRLLYENHCLGCHESSFHIRQNQKAQSVEDVRMQVLRWSAEQKLAWQDKEIDDVVRYLSRTFYTGRRQDEAIER